MKEKSKEIPTLKGRIEEQEAQIEILLGYIPSKNKGLELTDFLKNIPDSQRHRKQARYAAGEQLEMDSLREKQPDDKNLKE